MGEHKTNPEAMFAASLPPLMPFNEAVAIDFQAVVMPKPNVLLLPAKDIGDEGRKIRLPGKDDFEDAPEGSEVFELGAQLPLDKCDVVIVLGTLVRGREAKISVAGRETPSKLSRVGHVPFHRMSLDKWRAEHLTNLGESEKIC